VSHRDGRTELQALFDFVRPGDTLVVTRIDRLACSMKDLLDIVDELKGRGVALRATEQPVDTGTAAGKPFLDMLGMLRSLRPTCGASANSKASRCQDARCLQRAQAQH
jgi:DNA invertase Pin-like site-specific DNA recombinase